MIAAIDPSKAAIAAINPATTPSNPMGCSRQCFTTQFAAFRSGGNSPCHAKKPGIRSIGCSSQFLAFQRCHQFMSALSGAGCVGATSIAQGRADTLSHLSLNKTSKKEA